MSAADCGPSVGGPAADTMADLDLAAALAFTDLALSALGDAREEIDAINVYPVPDGDTGTNLFLTFEAGHAAMWESLGSSGRDEGPGPGDLADPGLASRAALATSLTAFARGTLTGARGNSGVIFSQLVSALTRRLVEAGPGERLTTAFAEGLVCASDAAYAAVGAPVEGTILSVARAAAEAATASAREDRSRLGHVIRAAATAGRAELARTPRDLPVLGEAGVVDAGGRGLCVVLDAAETAATGRRPVSAQPLLGTRAIPVPLPRPVPAGDLTADGPAYEVMFLLDAGDEAVPVLRRELAPLGDSLVVVGGDALWNVHVHVDDVGAVLEAAMRAGRPHRVRVTHFAEQPSAERDLDAAPRRRPARAGRSVVAVAAGAGLGELFVRAGATVVAGGSGRRPSLEAIEEAVLATATDEVIVLPNSRESVAACEAVARALRDDHGIRVAVIPTHAQVQGLAAMAVHEPGRGFEHDIVEMSAAARHARSGAVTVATRRAMTTAGPCEAGDVLGVIEGDFAVVGQDLLAVGVEVLERLLGGGGELVTMVSGAGGEDLADRCADYLRRTRPTVDVVTYEGGQARYPLLVGVE